jgi:tripartite-type tricarboxylate transporter receptor subunit TctC
VKKLNAEFARILKLPNIRERLVGLGLEPVSISTEEFARFMRAETLKWDKVIKAAGIVAD